MFGKKKTKTPEKFRVPDLTKLHIDMLLYRSVEHYKLWTVFGNHPDRKVVLEFGKVHIPKSIYAESMGMKDGIFKIPEETLSLASTPPEIVDSYGFTTFDLAEICNKYQLYSWEKEQNKCPFCRISSSNQMRVLSSFYKEGRIERGGVACYCIHTILDDEDYEALGLKDWFANLKRFERET